MEHLESALRLEPGHAPTERVLHRLRKERAQKGAEGDVEEKKGTEGSERKDRAAGGPEASAEP